MEMEESNSIAVNNSGAYHSVCIELEVTSLAVNTIIEVRFAQGWRGWFACVHGSFVFAHACACVYWELGVRVWLGADYQQSWIRARDRARVKNGI